MFKKKALSFIVLGGLCLSFAWALAVVPNVIADDGIIGKIKNASNDNSASMDNVAGQVYGSNKDIKINNIITTVINTILGLLGVIFLILTLYAGFTWMTAMGNDEQVGKSKKILTAAIIGMVIVVTSYAISDFVLNALSNIK
ncbi:hypothetical protein COU00_02265 [Candidatus Falkowbacteria bacterium CG10_big_fil_rev_8_21_14_0_10_43_11]|uniref:Uncharacterized protein n=1 Tax=Candidatus Falkowbacteria bacterium CG10_big_fil_rev_8_21_14_0_10_43_11 TaxID=1974568 RepID=A0A2M6WLX5_9BACT|nr:MAG: hypothetical protein COU00_02265 [Candidatus Falkowbacteria bacterium CG10_big_fil_rev_8_21_14_0_10_43_11]